MSITKLRDLFDVYDIEGYIIPSTDEYLSEFTPHYAKRLEYISSFEGSNGICIVLINRALFFTDGRYTEQAKNQLDPDIFETFDFKDIANFSFDQYIGADETIGFDPHLFTKKTLSIFDKLSLKPIDDNLIDIIWDNQPARPSSKIYIYHEHFAGSSYHEKLKICRHSLEHYEASALVLTAADSICWLLNLRAGDVDFSPLMLGYLVVTSSTTYLFLDPRRISSEIIAARSDVQITPEESLADFLNNLQGKILYDENSTSIFISNLLLNKQHIQDPCKLVKACKNAVEIQHSIKAHIKDAVALCEMLAYIEYTPNLTLTEYEVGLKLTELRSKQSGYITNSFPPICGFKDNGAIIHYRARKDYSHQIIGDGLLLIDSGGQYLGATTDITRTIAIGKPTSEEIIRYTDVLKGHIALSNIIFPYGTTGANLDILARQFLWQNMLDYPHSTGHGVGSFLSVHEGPQAISLNNNIILKLGMILSNEPGYYLPNKFGIRIENLMYIHKIDNSNFLQFKTLSLVPYAKELIDFSRLLSSEIQYLNQYYQNILRQVHHLLTPQAQEWLIFQTKL